MHVTILCLYILILLMYWCVYVWWCHRSKDWRHYGWSVVGSLPATVLTSNTILILGDMSCLILEWKYESFQNKMSSGNYVLVLILYFNILVTSKAEKYWVTCYPVWFFLQYFLLKVPVQYGKGCTFFWAL